MHDPTGKTVETFLNDVADRTPTPGGGGVTALAGALSCAMGRMVVAYSITKNTEAQAAAKRQQLLNQLGRVDDMLRALITQDAQAYQAMVEAAKQACQDELHTRRHVECVLRAIAVPMEMAGLTTGALELLDGFKSSASRYLLSDLGVAAVLAEATTRAARYSVLVNTRELQDPAHRDRIEREINTFVHRSDRHRESIEAFVAERFS